MADEKTPEEVKTPETEDAEPITQEEYEKRMADAQLDRAKLMLVRMEHQNKLHQIEYAIASIDAVVTELNRRRVYTLTSGKEPGSDK